MLQTRSASAVPSSKGCVGSSSSEHKISNSSNCWHGKVAKHRKASQSLAKPRKALQSAKQHFYRGWQMSQLNITMHHPTIGDIISNRYGKCSKSPKKGHLPTPVLGSQSKAYVAVRLQAECLLLPVNIGPSPGTACPQNVCVDLNRRSANHNEALGPPAFR